MGFVYQDINDVSNKHVWEFLRYYLALDHAPKYAVFIDGPWGAGKTHLVQKIVEDHFRGWKDDYVKVSLFGLSSPDDLDNAVFSAVYPMLTSPGSHVIGGVVKAGLSFLRASTDMRLQKILNKKNASLYIFDDLERCEIELGKVLGYINSFVEHGAKVIVIGDQARLGVTQSEENLVRYKIEREKVVGKTLKVEPSYLEAFRAFVASLHDANVRSFILINEAVIKSIFDESKTNNLRLLQLTLLDFERIFLALTPTHRANIDAMRELIKLFFAVSFEVKRGRLSEEDITKREEGLGAALRRALSNGNSKEPLPIEVAENSYSNVDIKSQLITNEIFIDLFFKGVVNEPSIHQALDRSRFFVQEIESPSWIRMIHVLDLLDEDFEIALQDIESKFQTREYVLVGEILHVFSHRLWLARRSLLPESVDIVFTQCVDYLDCIYQQGRLELKENQGSRIYSSYAGYVYRESGEAEFIEILSHLRMLLERVKVDEYPQLAQILLDEMQQDAELFRRRICLTNSADNKFWNVPLLLYINANEFAIRLLRNSPEHQRIVMTALGQRYEISNERDSLLRIEAQWLAELQDILSQRAEALPRLSRERIRIFIHGNITVVLDQWRLRQDSKH